MSDLTHPATFHTAIARRPMPVRKAARRSLWRALVDAIINAHHKDAQRDIDRLVARSGGKFTDSLEREIGEHMRRHTWNVGP